MKTLVVLLTISMACSVSSAGFEAIVWDGTGSTVGDAWMGYNYSGSNLALGNLFEVGEDNLTVTALGIGLADGSNPPTGWHAPPPEPYTIELYEVTDPDLSDNIIDSWTLLDSVQFSAGDMGYEQGIFNYKDIDPVVLVAGTSYQVVEHMQLNAVWWGDIAPQASPGLTYTGNCWAQPPVPGSPAVNIEPPTRGFAVGPTFQYNTGDPVGTIDPCSISVTEAAGASHTVTYTITLTEAIPGDAEFAVYLDPCDLWDGGLKQATVTPAKAGDPNTALDILFTSANWDTPATVTVTAFDDAIGELPVNLALYHSLVLVSGSVNSETDPNWAGAGLVNSSVAAAVVDDDMRYAVVVDELGGLSVSETGPTSDEFTVVIEQLPTIDVTVNLATDGETTLSSSAIVFNSGNWNVPQTVTVTAIDDEVAEADPLTSDISYSVDVGTLTYTSLASDNFNNIFEDGWTTYINEPGADANAVHDGSQLLVYGSTMAIAPGDYTAPYRVTVECDFRGNVNNVIYLRNDGVSHWYENNNMIRCGYWTGRGGSLDFNIGDNNHGQYGEPIAGWGEDPNVYRFIIEDLGNTITVRMENAANPSHYLEASATGDYAAIGGGSRIALGLIEDDNSYQDEYIAFDNFEVEQLAAGQDEKIAWYSAPIEVVGELDGDAEVNDNDCMVGRDDTLFADFDKDCDVDLVDFAVLADEYLDCSKPNSGACY